MTEELVDNLEQQTEERNEGEGKNKFFIYNFDFQKYEDFGKGT